MERKQKILDFASVLTLALTLIFFAIALFEKGLTHDMLLEAGVFMVSAKLVIANVQFKSSLESLEAKLEQILKK